MIAGIVFLGLTASGKKMEWNIELLCWVSQQASPELGSTGRGLKGQKGCAAKMRETDVVPMSSNICLIGSKKDY
jgi:hypothetical protein